MSDHAAPSRGAIAMGGMFAGAALLVGFVIGFVIGGDRAWAEKRLAEITHAEALEKLGVVPPEGTWKIRMCAFVYNKHIGHTISFGVGYIVPIPKAETEPLSFKGWEWVTEGSLADWFEKWKRGQRKRPKE